MSTLRLGYLRFFLIKTNLSVLFHFTDLWKVPGVCSYFTSEIPNCNSKNFMTFSMQPWRLVCPGFLQKRGLCTTKKWGVKQVTRSNLGPAVEQLKDQVHDADFVSVSVQCTGSHAAPWRRILEFDNYECAYYKAKDSAERFQLLHFTVCPLKWSGDSKIIAFPYNFHLFPRDEWRVGMPSYNFLCQISLISSMAQKGFDFNSCVYEGISYISRAQEASLKQQYGSTRMIVAYPASSSQNKSTTDTIFMERIRFQMQHWRHACLASEGGVVSSIETIALNNKIFGTRPCLRINAANNHQVQLILEVLIEFTENLVPLTSSDGIGTENELKVVFTRSEEDKHHLLGELQHQAEQLGIRDVINTIINSRKTIVGHNCLTDLTIIYSNFIAPLPATVKEFLYSLHSVFPHLIDVSHLLKAAYSKEMSHMTTEKSLQAAILHLNRQFILPMNLEVPLEFKCYGYRGHKSHGYTVLRLTYLFAKICRLLKIKSSNGTADGWLEALADYADILYPGGTLPNKAKNEGEVVKLVGDSSNLKTSNIIFIWGFKLGSSSRNLLEMLCNIHNMCEKGVEVQLVDDSCAYIRFKKSRNAKIFLQDVQSGTDISGFAKSKPLEEITKMGLKAVRYDIYEKLCKSSVWKTNLADSFECFMAESGDYMAHSFTTDIVSSKNSSFIIELEDL